MMKGPDLGSSTSQDMEPDFGVGVSVDDSHKNDIGRYVGQSSMISTEKKKQLLKDCLIPPKTYNFLEEPTLLKRKFNHQWLETYSLGWNTPSA